MNAGKRQSPTIVVAAMAVAIVCRDAARADRFSSGDENDRTCDRPCYLVEFGVRDE